MRTLSNRFDSHSLWPAFSLSINFIHSLHSFNLKFFVSELVKLKKWKTGTVDISNSNLIVLISKALAQIICPRYYYTATSNHIYSLRNSKNALNNNGKQKPCRFQILSSLSFYANLQASTLNSCTWLNWSRRNTLELKLQVFSCFHHRLQVTFLLLFKVLHCIN